MSRRSVYKASGSAEARDLLQSIFTIEMLRPSRELWIVSPWISDTPILDNSAGGFSDIDPSWPHSTILLSSVLIAVAMRGTIVRVHTRAESSRGMVDKLRRRAHLEQVTLEIRDVGHTLHSKGLAGDAYLLSGSMNITHNGVEILDELLHYDTDAAAVHEAGLEFLKQWNEVGGR